ncbi:hypothetical protein KSP40_PGU008537 [Platanthera guangdongensis]|uniref:Uncharacterized protein n=1 Tax=Platanthera guangdongensis TaxID=2320717 RepID=A0ABR2LIA9_9ASPA
MFEGNQLHCKLAFDHSQKGRSPAIAGAPQSLPVINQQPALSAMAAAQNAAFLSQNPAYGMMFVQNPLLANAALNQNSIAALNPAALAAFNPSASLIAPQGQSFYGAELCLGVGLGGSTVFGPYGALESGGLSYGGSQLGQSSSGTQGNGYLGGFRQ